MSSETSVLKCECTHEDLMIYDDATFLCKHFPQTRRHYSLFDFYLILAFSRWDVNELIYFPAKEDTSLLGFVLPENMGEKHINYPELTKKYI